MQGNADGDERARSAQGSPLIFVIEDDTDIRDVLGALLSDEGYAVRTWPNALEALTAMDAGLRPDLIVLDLMMPHMDGWQFRVEQRGRPHIADVPVLVVSADGSPKAAAVDADAFMKKPLDFSRLTAVIERLIIAAERRRLGTQSRETERLRSLGTLVAGVAHEINNPLTFVSGSLELAMRSLRALQLGPAAPANAENAARRIEQAIADARVGTERIASIVAALSHFARLESEHTDPVDLHRVLDGAITLASGALRTRARLVKRYGEIPLVVGSEARLGQVFLNLVVNAAQAIPEGEGALGTVEIVTGVTDTAVFVEIADTGSGIPAELQGRIFEPFFTTKPAGEGTGLGLSISHDIVRAHGGEIRVRSAVGVGTTFRVELPLHAAVTAPGTSDAQEAQSGERRRPSVAPRRARSRVAGRAPMVCKLLTRVLAAHDVVAHTRAQEALAALRNEDVDFDLVLCDLSMPGMDGITFHREACAMRPSLHTRFVFMTGAASGEGVRRFLADTARPVLEKPFPVDGLLRLVDTELEARKSRPPRPLARETA